MPDIYANCTRTTPAPCQPHNPSHPTRLHYVCTSLLGPPLYSTSECSYWPCPICDSSTFHTLPNRPEFQDRVKCFGCNWLGDELDVARAVHKDKADEVMAALQRAWVAGTAPGTATAAGPASPLFFPAARAPKGQRWPWCKCSSRDQETIALDAYSPEADVAVAELAHIDQEAAIAALVTCARLGLHPLALAHRLGHELWRAETNAEHMAVCTDLACEWWCCRNRKTTTITEAGRGIMER